MKPLSAPRLESLKLPALPMFLLLDYQPDLHERVYQLHRKPQLSLLFDNTPLQEIAEQSPILLAIDEKSAVYSAFIEEPEQWPGLLLLSDQSQSEILSSLRRCLVVRFEEVRKGVLRYYDPKVASYLLPACASEAMTNLFSSISAIVWYGGTWAAEAGETLQWHVVFQEQTQSPLTLEKEPRLSEAQEQALVQMAHDRFVWQWCRNGGATPFLEACIHLREGLALGYDDSERLAEYLDFRSQQPDIHRPAIKLLRGDEELQHFHRH